MVPAAEARQRRRHQRAHSAPHARGRAHAQSRRRRQVQGVRGLAAPLLHPLQHPQSEDKQDEPCDQQGLRARDSEISRRGADKGGQLREQPDLQLKRVVLLHGHAGQCGGRAQAEA